MREPTSKDKDTEAIPDEEQFRQSLLCVERFGKQTHETARRLKDLLDIEKERGARESELLRARVKEKENELEQLRKELIDVRMELSESRRGENSLKLEVKQQKEQLSAFKVDGERIEQSRRLLGDANNEIARLKTRAEALEADAAKLRRDHKSEIDALVLRYEQEKIQLRENAQIAADKARGILDTIERYKSQAALAEKEKAAALEELQRGRNDQKQQMEKLRGALALREAAASEQERLAADMQSDYERKLALAQSRAEQTYQTQIESLRHTNEDQLHELARLRYQMEQMKEDHRRALEALKQDMEKQITLRADEIRRQYILRSSGQNAGA